MKKRAIAPWLPMVLCTLALLCFLSALIITPDAPSQEPAPLSEPIAATAILPYALPAPDAQPDAPRLDLGAKYQAMLEPQNEMSLYNLSAHRDSNGHVIANRRYLDNVYQAFRQETACG